MTMTLEQLVAIEGYADEHGAVTDEMLTLLIDFAKAHLSQPQPVAQGEAVGWVAWHPEHGYGLPHGPVELCRSPAEPYCDDGWRPVPLYAAPAIPTGHRVVPDALPDDAVIFGDDDDDGYRMGWNACRKAMLAAAPDAGGV